MVPLKKHPKLTKRQIRKLARNTQNHRVPGADNIGPMATPNNGPNTEPLFPAKLLQVSPRTNAKKPRLAGLLQTKSLNVGPLPRLCQTFFHTTTERFFVSLALKTLTLFASGL
jgi:hypothetical protein